MTPSRRDFLKYAAAATVPAIPFSPFADLSGAKHADHGFAACPTGCTPPWPLVKRFINQSATALTPLGTGSSPTLPNTSIILAPGSYVFDGLVYDCSAAGLYRFWSAAWGGPVQSRIVTSFGGFGPNIGGVYDLLSAVCWHHAHGVDDEDLVNHTGIYAGMLSDPQLLSNRGLTHKWRLRCGNIVQLMMWLLPQFGFPRGTGVRRISVRSDPSLTWQNNLDDGHVVLEVYINNTWRLFDLTNACYFTYGGVHLSADDIISHGVLNCTRVALDGGYDQGAGVVDLSSGPGGGWSTACETRSSNEFCMSSYADLAWSTPSDKDAWFARIYQVATVSEMPDSSPGLWWYDG